MADGILNFKNDWGETLTSVYIRHRQGNEPAKESASTHYNVDPGNKINNALTFTYGTPRDYWWIKFVTSNGRLYTIKDNFYCSVGSDDNGIVEFRIDGSDEKLHVSFSRSSGCTVSIYKASFIIVDEKNEVSIINE